MATIKTQNSGPQRLTKSFQAAEILRSKLESGQIKTTDDPDDVHKSHPAFSQHPEDRFALFFIRRVMEFEGELKYTF